MKTAFSFIGQLRMIDYFRRCHPWCQPKCLGSVDVYLDTWDEEDLSTLPNVFDHVDVCVHSRKEFHEQVLDSDLGSQLVEKLSYTRNYDSPEHIIDRHLSQFWCTHKFFSRVDIDLYSLMVKSRVDCYFYEREFLHSVLDQHADRFDHSQEFISAEPHNSDRLDQWQSFFLPLNKLSWDRDQTPVALCQTSVKMPLGQHGILNDTAIGFDRIHARKIAEPKWMDTVMQTYIDLAEGNTAVPSGDLVWYELLKEGFMVEDARFDATKIYPWSEIPNAL